LCLQTPKTMSSAYRCLLTFVTLWLLCQESVVAQHVSGCDTPEFYYFDGDGDGYGNQNYTQSMKHDLIDRFYNNSVVGYVFGSHMLYGCMDMVLADEELAYLEEFVDNDLDCKDNNADIFPGSIWYYDSDGDGDGNPNIFKAFDCAPDPNYVKRNGDCNDNDAKIHSRTVWYLDNDGDGTGGSTTFTGCTPPSNQYVLTAGDECDNNPDTLEKLLWYYDADNDGFAGSAITIKACAAPDRYYATADDCDDSNPFLNPKTVWLWL